MARLNNKKSLKETRKDLRNNSTKEEQLLWLQLKGRRLKGKKFRRQHSYGDFILDFYCPEEKLAVELDGSPHYTQEGHQSDLERDSALTLCGIRVLRFENREVREDILGVLRVIGEYLGTIKSPVGQKDDEPPDGSVSTSRAPSTTPQPPS
ncbi:endonuclease domain-containing protein [Cyclobacterium plantarum]|uniref:Endonuclease domain-containing protein n=1 Tax=Cyclobacterium plantarum TaxID=2716263 RepID=A0ABX0HF60_9BACT|nr:endonuclease domain-containing protein [Cyclobacterium plantarum]NHE58801.1 endonuclease domain-containing protein [Cyclobacterium plantarum]